MRTDCRIDLDGKVIAWKKYARIPLVGEELVIKDQRYAIVNRMMKFPANWNLVALLVEPKL